MSRVERYYKMENKFSRKVKEIWIAFYLRVISPCLTFLGNVCDKFETWLDNKLDNWAAKRQYLKAMYNIDPVARTCRDLRQIKILLVITMICVLILECVVIF